jgi:trans-2,3-dihydro-3-hydroxyanthranilate isomerase
MAKSKFYITDVFTTSKYGGNPLATFIDCEALSDIEMQNIAREINFSETTFITSRQATDGGYDVRIFTPTAEVEFAGHPSLGTAYIIRHKLCLTTENKVILNLRLGKIPVTFSEVDNNVMQVWMRQMAPKFGNQFEANKLAHILGLAATDIDLKSPIEEVSTGFPTIIVPLATHSALKRAKINKGEYFGMIKDTWAKLILVYSQEGYESGEDIGVRVFADFYGIAEDAATGSSNGALAAYLLRHQIFDQSNVDVCVGQGYEIGRPSKLFLRASNATAEAEVFVGGSVVSIAEGEWG